MKNKIKIIFEGKNFDNKDSFYFRGQHAILELEDTNTVSIAVQSKLNGKNKGKYYTRLWLKRFFDMGKRTPKADSQLFDNYEDAYNNAIERLNSIEL